MQYFENFCGRRFIAAMAGERRSSRGCLNSQIAKPRGRSTLIAPESDIEVDRDAFGEITLHQQDSPIVHRQRWQDPGGVPACPLGEERSIVRVENTIGSQRTLPFLDRSTVHVALDFEERQVRVFIGPVAQLETPAQLIVVLVVVP